MIKELPTTVLTGALGVGKTTAIRHAFAHLRPPGERWSVLVNEFGKVGLDGPLMQGAEGLSVKQVAGGCICCAAGLELKVALAQLIRQTKPDRLLIEPSGLAKPTVVLDALTDPGLALGKATTLCLVALDRPLPQSVVAVEQARVADILIGNRRDQASATQQEAFVAWANSLSPAKAVVAMTEEGKLLGEWLDVKRTQITADGQLPTPLWVGIPTPLMPAQPHTEAGTKGWIWPPDQVFDAQQILSALQTMMGPMQDQVIRAKAIFRTSRGWRSFQGVPDQVRVEGALWRTDSRLEVIVQRPETFGWSVIESLVQGAKLMDEQV